jgi:hypothetical protein
MSALQATTAPAELATLAAAINQEHRLCEGALRAGLAHAVRAGELLMQAKALCAHGAWLPWLAANFEGSERTAQAYMRVAREAPALADGNPQRVADLSFRGALAALAAPSGPGAGAVVAGPRMPELSPRQMAELWVSLVDGEDEPPAVAEWHAFPARFAAVAAERREAALALPDQLERMRALVALRRELLYVENYLREERVWSGWLIGRRVAALGYSDAVAALARVGIRRRDVRECLEWAELEDFDIARLVHEVSRDDEELNLDELRWRARHVRRARDVNRMMSERAERAGAGAAS